MWRVRPLPFGEPEIIPRVFGREIKVTFVNHSTVLIQTEGLNILTDPVWAKYASPFPFLGPKRYMPAGIAFDSLPDIDLILLTHNHYDHMDISALSKISKKFKPQIFTTLGNTKYLEKNDIIKSFDMDWGQTRCFSDEVSIGCVPSQHFSARAITDRNKTLWAGFVIHTHHGDIYFAGDTGYGPCVERIRKMYPNGFRLAFLPIGAYEPKIFMQDFHSSPDEAVEMHKQLNVSQSIPIHFGTFALALDGQDDPTDELKEILAKEENKSVRFDILLNGQTLTVK